MTRASSETGRVLCDGAAPLRRLLAPRGHFPRHEHRRVLAAVQVVDERRSEDWNRSRILACLFRSALRQGFGSVRPRSRGLLTTAVLRSFLEAAAFEAEGANRRLRGRGLRGIADLTQHALRGSWHLKPVFKSLELSGTSACLTRDLYSKIKIGAFYAGYAIRRPSVISREQAPRFVLDGCSVTHIIRGQI